MIHSAGVLSDRSLPNQDWASFERVWWPKVLGAWNLHRATLDLDLDLFLLFSSTTGLLGNPGQANYAGANAFLDQLALLRRDLGLPGQAIQWGVWSGVGEAEEQRERIETGMRWAGVGWMTPQQGLAALARVVREDVGVSLVSMTDWTAFARSLAKPPSLLADLAVPAAAPDVPALDDDLVSRLGGVGSSNRERLLVEFVRDAVRSVLRLPEPPPLDVGFFDLGMDSLMAVELRNRVNRGLAGQYVAPATAVFDYPNIRLLAGLVAESLEEPGAVAREVRPWRQAALESRVAIVGMACRFPGSDSLAGFRDQLASGGDAITAGRPDDLPVDEETREAQAWGGYLAGLDRFDAAFFRIAPAEAEQLDPQQRLLLEISWEALEEAGFDPAGLRGSRTGVWFGVAASEYRAVLEQAKPSFHAATGTNAAAAVGRVAFTLGLEGPATAVDTACSSSLVAVHHAIVSLERGEVDLALAGGVNVILTASSTRLFEEAGVVSPDGRCKTFDARANGYVRGEGCGVVALKRLSDAERDGDRILGVLLGSAVNQDGASAGLTVPNGRAQERVIREALDRAGVEPSGVDYLEAHGSGTALGDPIEIRAAAAVYGEGRDAERPLLVGAVKTNIGHLETAAGIAGLIKAVLGLGEDTIPRHLHFERPNPRLDWERLPVRVVSEPTAWPATHGRPRRAAVSSFGFSGTNAHVVLESYEPAAEERDGAALLPASEAGEPAETKDRRFRVLPLSGRTEAAVPALARRYLNWLEGRGAEASREALSDAAWTAGVGRSHFGHRAGLVFSDTGDLRQQIADLSSGASSAKGAGEEGSVKVAFLFTGQGSQWEGMGRELYEREPVVRDVLDRLDRAFFDERGRSLLDVMFGGAGSERSGELAETSFTQPALYALGCSLTALWRSVGVVPDAVLGHSVGEIAAAQAAGVVDLEDGLRFASRRGRLMGSLPASGSGAGGMAAVFASAGRVMELLAASNAEDGGTPLEVAADNGAHQVVSGPKERLVEFEARLAAVGIRVQRLSTSHAFHSALMDPVLDELEELASGFPTAAPERALVTNLTGRALGPGEDLGGGYWRAQARSPVAFRAGVGTLAELGATVLVEIGPRAVLGPLALLAWPSSEGPAAGPLVTPSLSGPGTPGDEAFARAFASLYEAGVPVSFAGLFAGERRRRTALPTYPFERRSHWIRGTRRRPLRDGRPLLGERHASARGEVVYETELGERELEWLGDHRVFGQVVAPAALYAAQALASLEAPEAEGLAGFVEEVSVERPLMLPAEEAADNAGTRRAVQLVLGRPEGSGSRRFEVYSRNSESEADWVLHAAGRVRVAAAPADASSRRFDGRGRLTLVEAEELRGRYARLAEAGIAFGPAFRGVRRLWEGDREALGEIEAPEGIVEIGGRLHPALLDACFQVLMGAQVPGEPGDGGSDRVWLPVGWERLWLRRASPARLLCHAELDAEGEDGDPGVRRGNLALYDEDGALIGGVSGFGLRSASRSALATASAGIGDLLYEVRWVESRRGGQAGLPSAAFLGDPENTVARNPEYEGYLASENVSGEQVRELGRGLERLARAYAVRALDELGWERRPGTSVRPEELRRQLRVLDQHRRLFGRLGVLLEESGELTRDERAGWVVAPSSGAGREAPEELVDRLLARHPEGAVEVRLLERCGVRLADVLRGRAEGADLLSSGSPNAADFYRDSSGLRALNRMVADLVASAVAKLPEDRRLTVIEVGAGAGATTAAVLAGAAGGTVRLLLHRSGCRFLLGRGSDVRGGRAVPGPGSGAGSGRARLRSPPGRSGGGGKCSVCHEGPRQNAVPLPGVAGSGRDVGGRRGRRRQWFRGPDVRVGGGLVALRRRLPPGAPAHRPRGMGTRAG